MSLWKNKNWQPMLLKEIKKPFNDPNYIYELKFDGFRAIIFASPKYLKIQNRKGQDITNLYPELQDIKKLVHQKMIFDGEIILLENGVPSFQKLQARAHIKKKEKIQYQSIHNPVLFVCFDLLYADKDLTDYPLIKRKKILSSVIENDVFIKVKQIETYGIPFFKEVKKRNLEGIVAKKKDSAYTINTRTDSWVKIKNLKSEIFYIGGYQEKEKNAIISLLLVEKQNNTFMFIGKVLMTKKNQLYVKIKKLKPQQIPSFKNKKEKAIYIKPIYSCEVEYLERTKDNQLRHPLFLKEKKITK